MAVAMPVQGAAGCRYPKALTEAEVTMHP